MSDPTPEEVIKDALWLEWEAHAYCRPFSECGPEQASQVATALREAGHIKDEAAIRADEREMLATMLERDFVGGHIIAEDIRAQGGDNAG
jgi:hypothetical protein